jgi:hypothetical protein
VFQKMVGRMIAAVFDKRRVHQPPYALIASLILTQPYFLLSHSWSTSAFRTRPAVAPAEALPKYDDVFDDDVFVGELIPPEEVLDSLAAGASLVGFLNWFSNGPFTAYGRGRPLFVMCRLFASPLCFRKRIKFSSPSSSHRYTHAAIVKEKGQSRVGESGCTVYRDGQTVTSFGKTLHLTCMQSA